VSCPAATACTAVGSYATTAFNGFTLAERWDGTAWSIQRTPNRPGTDQLLGVSCPAADACTAIGSYTLGDQTFPLAESWHGTAWSLQLVPVPPGASTSSLTGVWCTAATACTAAGQFLDHPAAQDFALAERWNGTAWSIQHPPTPPGAADAFLHGVSCPAATACTAVGDFFPQTGTVQTLAQHWDGTSWSVQPTPNPGGGQDALTAVACPSTTSCVAVGTQFRGFALAERFGA
jgi:hypothetical protein